MRELEERQKSMLSERDYAIARLNVFGLVDAFSVDFTSEVHLLTYTSLSQWTNVQATREHSTNIHRSGKFEASIHACSYSCAHSNRETTTRSRRKK